MDSAGNIIWQKTYGGTNSDYAFAIQQAADGGYIIAAQTRSFGAGNFDVFILKTDSNGDLDTSCDIVSSSTAVPVSTNSSIIYPSYINTSISFTATDVNFPGIDSNAIDTMICSSPGAIPDNDDYPGTPLSIAKSGSDLILSWSAPGGSCTTQDYGTYRGTLPWIGYNYVPIMCSTSGLTNFSIPPGTESYYYIVVAQNNNLEGSYGLDAYNLQRPVSATPCFPQQVGSCN